MLHERRAVYGDAAIADARRYKVPSELKTVEVRDDERLIVAVGSIERAVALVARDPQLVWVEWPVVPRFQAIVSSFPTLRRADGADPWHPTVLLRWLCEGGQAHSVTLAATFVLGAWNTSTDWVELAEELEFPYPKAAERFDALQALTIWDDQHRAAFAAFAQRPYFP
jgi:hypothetical protein